MLLSVKKFDNGAIKNIFLLHSTIENIETLFLAEDESNSLDLERIKRNPADTVVGALRNAFAQRCKNSNIAKRLITRSKARRIKLMYVIWLNQLGEPSSYVFFEKPLLTNINLLVHKSNLNLDLPIKGNEEILPIRSFGTANIFSKKMMAKAPFSQKPVVTKDTFQDMFSESKLNLFVDAEIPFRSNPSGDGDVYLSPQICQSLVTGGDPLALRLDYLSNLENFGFEADSDGNNCLRDAFRSVIPLRKPNGKEWQLPVFADISGLNTVPDIHWNAFARYLEGLRLSSVNLEGVPDGTSPV